jgi:hypothetical protein
MILAVPVTAQQGGTPQGDRQGGIGVGIKAGPLFATIDDVDNSFAKSTGLVGGLFLGGNRGGTVGVGIDLLYARKGGKDPDSDAKLNLDYLNVPVYARVNIGSSNRNRFLGYGTVGVDLNFLIKGKLSVGGSDVTDQFERADYGIAVGFGVEITRLIVEGRFTRGLGNIAKDKDDPELKTQTFAVMVGVRLN